jgi:hypothetical protein
MFWQVSKYDNFHFFLLRMCQTKRHLKAILQQWGKKNPHLDVKFCTKNLAHDDSLHTQNLDRQQFTKTLDQTN